MGVTKFCITADLDSSAFLSLCTLTLPVWLKPPGENLQENAIIGYSWCPRSHNKERFCERHLPFMQRDASVRDCECLQADWHQAPRQCPHPQLWSLSAMRHSPWEAHRCTFNRGLWGTIASDWDAIPLMLEIDGSIINFVLNDSTTPPLPYVLKGSV